MSILLEEKIYFVGKLKIKDIILKDIINMILWRNDSL